MALKLTLAGGRGARTLGTGTLSIGRGDGNDWVLPDPDRHLSKTHCVISIEDGRWVLTDLSTNGVYINGARQPTSRDSRTVLTDGDEFRLGENSFTIEETADTGRDTRPAAPAGYGASLHEGGSPLDIDPLDDPLGAPIGHGADAFSHPVRHAAPSNRAPDPFDREDEARHRRTDPDDDLFRGVTPAVNWTGPSQSDHADAPRHAMPLPKVIPPSSMNEIDFDALIGDLSGFEPARPATPPPAPPLTPPPAPASRAPQARPPAPAQIPPSGNPFDAFDDLIGDPSAPLARAPAAPPRPQPPAPPPAPQADAGENDPFFEPPSPRPAAQAPTRPAPPPTPTPAPATTAPASPAPADALLAALQLFLEGAGVGHMPPPADPQAALRAFGQVFRVMTEGLREVLMSRTTVKGELRVEQTMIRATNNNPLKFSMTPEDAVTALLSTGRPGYMPPLAAAREAFDDLKTHELAVMAGVQTALVSLLRRFDPDALESRLVQGKLSAVLPASRKARLWDSFRDTYKTIASEAEDDFQAVFGRAFAKAYMEQSRKD